LAVPELFGAKPPAPRCPADGQSPARSRGAKRHEHFRIDNEQDLQPRRRCDIGRSADGRQPAPGGSRGNPDVGAVLEEMALMKGGGGNYRTSIVDLLHLLDLDSSLAARKDLADELGVRVGADGTAEQNIALHKAVIAKLADNGGVVPDSMRD
jgi:hypothetical protein